MFVEFQSGSQTIYVNADLVRYISGNREGTALRFTNDDYVMVSMSPGEVFERIRSARLALARAIAAEQE